MAWLCNKFKFRICVGLGFERNSISKLKLTIAQKKIEDEAGAQAMAFIPKLF